MIFFSTYYTVKSVVNYLNSDFCQISSLLFLLNNCVCLYFFIAFCSGGSFDMEMYDVSETRNPDSYLVIFLL